MAADEKWYFTKEQLANTPSRKCGIDADKELSYRQQAANFIQDMGQRLVVTQLCINTAIVYMHRFYVFHSLSQFHRNAIAAAALFLAAKVEEQPRKLEHVIKVAHMCLHREQTPPDTKSEQYLEQAQDLVFNENVLLQTLGFDVAIDHPHTHVVRCCQLVKASKDLAQTSYFMASNSLHLTTMCLQYKPTVVACFCIHLACKWSNWEIPQSNEGKHWFWYVDRCVTAELLQQLTTEFLHIFDKCPSRLKKKIISISEKQSSTMHHPPAIANSPFDVEPRKVHSPAPDGGPTFQSQRIFSSDSKDEVKKPVTSLQSRPQVDYREHREKKERERLEREKMIGSSGSTSGHPQDPQKHHSHHHKQGSSSSIGPNPALIQGKHPISTQKTNSHHNYHHRPDPKLQQPPQKHTSSSSSSQSRDPSRDRPRLPIVPAYPHGQPGSHTKDPNPMTESPGVPEMSQILQDISHVFPNPTDRLSNNNHNPHRLQQHDKRGYDPRHKLVEHRKDETKNFMKFNDQVRQDRLRKPESIEQRSEEVRKLIEKPIQVPKPRAEVQKEEFIASMLKQSHHPSKYSDKIQATHNTGRGAFSYDFSKNSNPPKPLQQIPHSVPHQQMQQSSQHLHGPTQILKDIKNGNSNVSSGSGINVDDPKAEKRPRLEEPIPSVRHKSLFSPEKNPPSREIHSQRTKSIRQKTPPVVPVKATKERVPDIQMGLSNLISPFASPPGISESQQNPHGLQSLQVPKRNRTSGSAEMDSQAKLQTEESSHYESMKMLGRVPDLIQPIRDNPNSTNGRTSSVANDLKPPELIKPFDLDNITSRPQITNGLDFVGIKSESTFDQLALERLEMKNEYLSPLKSAQSISALLQEPLAPMPSLLSSSMTDSGIFSQPLSQQSTSSNNSSKSNNNNNRISENHQVSQQARNIPPEQHTKEETFAPPSTVDISALSTPAQVLPDLSVASNSGPNQDTLKQKSEHHKSEKKKKKEKHKHKDKSKEKHKHKHKEKHRENSAVPIRITIPKDKLNFGGETAEVSGVSSVLLDKKPGPQAAGLKIKIPKEKLKNPEPIQAPLKIKIRTSGTVGDFPESRKRDRTRDPIDGVPPTKKPSIPAVPQTFPGQQKPTDRPQNGRHYPVTSNKVRGGGRGVPGRQFNTRAPAPGLFNQNMREYYPSVDPQEIYNRNSRLPAPHPRPMGFNHGGAPDYYFSNYPPPTIFNPGAYFCDPTMFYQYQQQFPMYPQTSSLIMTADGAIDTSVPPPSFPMTANLNSDQTQPPPLPSGPPPDSSPPPPPPPE